ncbi:type I-E CRISPR-associated protein Cas5/CasD [Calidithermus roseus]|uniref:CRISPR system Cascade subunit CasD n=1 Tax=Calidithermus roseus TaxID=1644118 RepID=A0A399F4A4_9DEIN|nr:type I-E CRISPR-associated protein Cas5/CasD [Calidithermus roseus]RIH89451.1 CRISPR system Cascade subunit CasD [Calidithermus roseus]
MPTLLLRLAGPMQSWGTRSRFDERDTDLLPSKSGVIGLLCAAMGVDREERETVLQLADLLMGVRVDQPGVLRYDYQTAQNVIAADESKVHPTTVSRRYYLADAVFLVGLEGEDWGLLERAHRALKNPVWPLFLGRKGYVPSPGVFLPDGLRDEPLREALKYEFLGREWPKDENGLESARLPVMLENRDSSEGSLRMDQPLGSFAERRFGARFVIPDFVEVERVPKPAPA